MLARQAGLCRLLPCAARRRIHELRGQAFPANSPLSANAKIDFETTSRVDLPDHPAEGSSAGSASGFRAKARPIGDLCVLCGCPELPGSGIRSKRFTEGNEGNEEFAPPFWNEVKALAYLGYLLSKVPAAFGINAAAPFVSFVFFCSSESLPFEPKQSGLQKVTKATKSLPPPRFWKQSPSVASVASAVSLATET
jgi:hypothetical protein